MKSNKGITLVALIITIIIMIILAGISISLTIGQNGMFNKAKSGGSKYKDAHATELNELNAFENEVDNYFAENE